MTRCARARLLASLLALSCVTLSAAGPLGPLPNVTVTSTDLGLKEGGCLVGDVVYQAGEEFPGAAACERCRCAGGAVSCARERCEPRPGCKALHRPDHCCPTYQCECEQEGRVYGNGEKLVDPADPCRVCYCQGGEVVCRRIACFLRDDCTPRLVPGRCCPEYDNCPLRGVTSIPGVSTSAVEEISSSAAPAPTSPRENIKQEITIKEITPVSEIPVLPEVKVKEVLPTPGIEVPDYSSPKSPLIVREATSESPVTAGVDTKNETPLLIEVHQSSEEVQSPTPSEQPIRYDAERTHANDSPPSKISLSTQDSINSEMYPSSETTATSKSQPSSTPEIAAVTPGTTKAPIIEEEDPILFEHNPAFPPLPDDLSVLSNHEDELMPEPGEVEHMLEPEITDPPGGGMHHPVTTTVATPVATTAPPLPTSTLSISTQSDTVSSPRVLSSTASATLSDNTESSPHPSSTQVTAMSNDISTSNSNTDIDLSSEASTIAVSTTSTKTTRVRDSPMLNLRSAIPTEILNMPSAVPEEITGELDEPKETFSSSTAESSTSSTVQSSTVTEKLTTENIKSLDLQSTTVEKTSSSFTTVSKADEITNEAIETTSSSPAVQTTAEQSVSPVAKTSIVTEITAQTEFSSLPIETSDQNPRENSDSFEKERRFTSTSEPATSEFAITKVSIPIETEVITVSKSSPSSTENHSYENIETTEFIITSFSSSESSTDNVELIKISAEPEKSAAIIESEKSKKNNVLTDLIDLVGDVASIGDHTEGPTAGAPLAASFAPGISDSEELIPVNAGYKSKNNNWNLNSITEVPLKSKNPPLATKQKVVEIEDDEAGITDLSPPGDRVEPTTRRPIIDRVSDDSRPGHNTSNKDIEIITRSYVPTINRRPTKVVMKKSGDKPLKEDPSPSSKPATEGSSIPPVSSSAIPTTDVPAPSSTITTSTGAASESGASTPASSTAAAGAGDSTSITDDVSGTSTLEH